MTEQTEDLTKHRVGKIGDVQLKPVADHHPTFFHCKNGNILSLADVMIHAYMTLKRTNQELTVEIWNQQEDALIEGLVGDVISTIETTEGNLPIMPIESQPLPGEQVQTPAPAVETPPADNPGDQAVSEGNSSDSNPGTVETENSTVQGSGDTSNQTTESETSTSSETHNGGEQLPDEDKQSEPAVNSLTESEQAAHTHQISDTGGVQVETGATEGNENSQTDGSANAPESSDEKKDETPAQ